MHDIELIGKLWQRYSYRDSQGYKSDRKKILKEYNVVSEIKIEEWKLKRCIAKLDKEYLYNEKHTKSFNDRVDEVIDKPHKLLTEEDILIAKGLDPLEFEMNDYNTTNAWWSDIPGETLRRIRNGQLKVGFRKRRKILDEITLDELLSKHIEPKHIESLARNPYGLLELTITDLHFGKNDYEHYKTHQGKILRWIHSQEWDSILIPLGNDLFHWDNIKGTTVNDTQVGFEPDLNKAWEDAMHFYTPIIETALKRSKNVHIVYVKGNHDATLAWAFTKMIVKEYPQLKSDVSFDNYKLFTWEKIAIGLSHGNEPRDFKKYAKIFNELYRMEFAKAEVREIHLGDKHHQMVHDEFGIVTRGLSTGSVTDQWHYNNGFIGASNSFQVFIYSENAIEAMIFI